MTKLKNLVIAVCSCLMCASPLTAQVAVSNSNPFLLPAQERSGASLSAALSAAVSSAVSAAVSPAGQTVQPNARIVQQTAKNVNIEQHASAVSSRKTPVRYLHGMPKGFHPVASQEKTSARPKVGEALVILSVVEPFYYYYSLGAQLLMDDGSGGAYSSLRYEWDLSEDAYSRFQYFIPANASCTHPEGSYIPVGEQQSLSVPAGGYDIMVADVSENLPYTVSCGFADTIPVQLTAGHQYLVEVHNGYFMVYDQAAKDIALTALLSHGPSEINLTSAETVTVEGVNAGTNAISSFQMTCVLDGGADSVTEEVTQNLSPGEYFTYTFQHKFDLSAKGEHRLVCKADLPGDEFLDNNIFTATVWNVEPVDLPYLCAFDKADEIENNWLADDANGDGLSWTMAQFDDETEAYAAFIHTARLSAGSPEALTMFRPVTMDTGWHHISFYISTAAWYMEDFDILCGQTTHVENMQVLREFRDIITDNEFVLYHVDFHIDAPGDYFFSVSARRGEDPYRFFMKELVIDTGLFDAMPDLQLETVISPLSSCALGAREELKVAVSNVGYREVEKIRFTGHILCPAAEDTVRIDTTLTVNLEVRERNREVSLGRFDFSRESDYNIEMEVSCAVQEDDMTNNRLQREVSHWTPLEIPFVSDFTGSRPGDAYWTCASGWSISPNGNNMISDDTVPLYSRCLNLKGGTTYRLTMTFTCGIFYYVAFLDDFVILYGQPGTDLSTWDTISSVKDGYTGNAFITRSVDFQPAQDGAYSLAILCNTPTGSFGTLAISHLKIHEVADYDVDLYYLGDLPSQVPEEHINNTFTLPVQVINKGRKGIEKAKVEITMNGTKVGEAFSRILNPGSDETFYVELDVNGLGIGDTAVFTAVASVPGHEEEDLTPEMNSLSVKTVVSDDVLAYDFVTEEMCHDRTHYIGSMVPFNFAMPLYVMADDTLTGVSVFFGEGEPYETMIAVLTYNDGLGDIVYYEYFRKSGEAGEQFFELPALLLPKGIYVISVQVKAIDLVTDHDPYGAYYYIDGGLWGVGGYGWCGIRGRFGHDAHPMARDAGVFNIQRPDHDAPFAENQTVVFETGNLGYEFSDVTYTLWIDGEKADESTMRLMPYERGTTQLTGDLSALGAHEITVKCYTQGDENPDNNEVKMRVNTVAPVDPYVMDFEYCEDFSIFDFNPDWLSVDLDGAYSPGYADIPDFPHMYEPFGFMAFNGGALGLTNSSMPVAYEGERFGACLYSSAGQNNDWLISPLLTLPLQDASLKFMARSEQERKQETFNVLVSQTPRIENFVPLEENLHAPAAWTEFNIDLSRYAGKSVYLAIQCVSEHMGMFMVDNIRVAKPSANEGSPLSARLQLYPSPAREAITISGSDVAIEQVSILNAAGREIYVSKPLKGVQGGAFRYSVEMLPPGLYFARVKTSQGTSALKFIVK